MVNKLKKKETYFYCPDVLHYWLKFSDINFEQKCSAISQKLTGSMRTSYSVWIYKPGQQLWTVRNC